MKFTTALSLLLAGAATHSAQAVAPVVCDEGRYTGNGHYYKVFQYTKGTKTWQQAFNLAASSTYCGAKGHLVTITGSGENNHVIGLLDSAKCGTDHDSWIGLHDEKREGHYEWVTGEPYSWQNWCAGQPDNGGNEDYGEIWIDGNHGGCWNDNQADTNGRANGADNDKYIVEYDCKPAPSSSGDPHFKTWTGQKFDFHGGCDLVLLQNANFLNGLGLHVHVRTQIKTWWSLIESAVVRLGDNTLEIAGATEEGKIRYWLNGEEVEDMETGDAALGDYSVHFLRKNLHQSTTRIDLGNNNAMSIETFKDFVRVNIKADAPEKFNGSYGMLGAYPSGEQVGRDKKTVISDPNEFGFEWQVQPSEPNLFHSNSPVPHPMKCAMPEDTQESKARRLGESMITEEEAATACARVATEYRDACVFDVMATNDKDLAGSY